jgi:hypothetical protein
LSALLAPDLAQIERELDKLLTKDPGARVLGMCSPVHLVWPDHIERGGRRFRVSWCTSELEVRERLDTAEAENGEGVVVLTPLEALSCDVVARLPSGRLKQSDRWTVLRAAFRVRDVDPRLRARKWLADLLIERAPVGGYTAAGGGMLDLDAAWRALQEQVLGLPPGRTDVAALLEQWTHDLIGLERFATLPDSARQEVATRLTNAGGPGVGLLLGAALAGRGGDALAIGLVCGVVFAEDEPRPGLRDAAVRLEPLVGGAHLTRDAGRALAEAARRVLNRISGQDPATAHAIQLRAAMLLAEVRAEASAALSPALDLGLDARMQDAAAALIAAAASGTSDDTARAWTLAKHVKAHDRAEDQGARTDRLMMAARLACWLTAQRPPALRTMAEAAAGYAGDSGFADRARHALHPGDAIHEVSAAYTRLREVATARREQENRAFAECVQRWILDGARGTDPVPVELLLETVVAPLARHAHILLLVLDGLSFPVWRVLAETIPRLGWKEFSLLGRAAPLMAAAVLPTVTEVSRASLLCGVLTRGDQSTERAGFRAHSGLVAVSGAGRPPRLFHKGDLGPGPELAMDVRDAVADTQMRVVGVIHNAVDAQLSGSDQIDLSWSAEGMRQVTALLRIARDAGRVVVVTGDHGHVVEAGTTLFPGGVGDRWRTPGQVTEGEIALSGSRVIPPTGGNAVIAAWSERLRYAARHSGYHGGASPQEVLIPVAVFSAGAAPPGWCQVSPPEPAWWRGVTDETRVGVPLTVEQPNVAPTGRRKSEESRQPELFSAVRSAQIHESVHELPWVVALLASNTYAAQRRLAGRGAAADDQVRSLLAALAARGGRLSQASLAQALSMPVLRIGGIVNATRRILNVDQAQVLVIDGDEVVIDQRLLRVQFGIGNDL